MYQNIKSKLQTNEGSSLYFDCLNGVRQGENLSPFLVSIYLHDLENFLTCKNVVGIDINSLREDADTYFKLLVLLSADDTVLFNDNADDMQNGLDFFKEFCEKWHLNVNVDKTKIVEFRRGRHSRNRVFKIGDSEIETVSDYKYLGIYLSIGGSFNKTEKYLAEQANKALFSLLRKIKTLSLPFDVQTDLFEKIIKPILLYGSEMWGIW